MTRRPLCVARHDDAGFLTRAPSAALLRPRRRGSDTRRPRLFADHVAFTLYLEQVLQTIDATVSVPYWCV
jgi:hypothetical protein